MRFSAFPIALCRVSNYFLNTCSVYKKNRLKKKYFLSWISYKQRRLSSVCLQLPKLEFRPTSTWQLIHLLIQWFKQHSLRYKKKRITLSETFKIAIITFGIFFSLFLKGLLHIFFCLLLLNRSVIDRLLTSKLIWSGWRSSTALISHYSTIFILVFFLFLCFSCCNSSLIIFLKLNLLHIDLSLSLCFTHI